MTSKEFITRYSKDVSVKNAVGIYAIYCIGDDKIYVGQSKNIYRRWRHHKSKLDTKKHHNIHLQNAWNKYGKSLFLFIVLEICDVALLTEKEEFYLSQLDETLRFNLHIVREHMQMSSETKEKIANKLRGTDRLTKEGRKKLSEINKGNSNFKGRTHSEESKRKISERQIGKCLPEEQRRNQSLAHMGKIASDETKKKMSLAKKGKKLSPETISRMIAAQQKRRLEAKVYNRLQTTENNNE